MIRGTGLPRVVIDATFIYGDSDDIGLSFASYQAEAARTVSVLGNGTQRVAPMHVDDLAGLLAAAALNPTISTGTFEVSGPEILALDDSVRLINPGGVIMLPFLALAAWFGTRTRIFFRAFLIGHALVHVMYLVPEPPADQTSLEWSFHLDRSWVFSALGLTSQTVRIVGAVLVVVAVVGFIATGDGPPRGRSEAGFSESKQAPRGWRNAVRSYRPRLPASAHQ